ncbi:NfeD family protein [Candidatus Acetothermia bacterium]|jgi:membrane-bound ClpP family serine protease|nr:NfeD family protein [Candidatus Acetothermia bacterium]MCI2431293.1 NfeD family protein [Candidatus Acetothermia bacterium]MCI2436250.1 NfeD family protein [Candidatus Acetothermia bacterium]
MIVFIIIAGVGLLLLLLSALGGFFEDINAAPEVEGGGHGFLSMRSIAVFLTVFGTVGAIGSYYNLRPMLSSLWGILAGLAMSGIYLFAMNLVRSQEASSLIGSTDLIGLTGRVTVTIPSDGLGEVSCTVKAQRTQRMARARDLQAIPEGALVRIIEIQGDVVIVEKI